jgi:hypothetical protein
MLKSRRAEDLRCGNQSAGTIRVLCAYGHQAGNSAKPKGPAPPARTRPTRRSGRRRRERAAGPPGLPLGRATRAAPRAAPPTLHGAKISFLFSVHSSPGYASPSPAEGFNPGDSQHRGRLTGLPRDSVRRGLRDTREKKNWSIQ